MNQHLTGSVFELPVLACVFCAPVCTLFLCICSTAYHHMVIILRQTKTSSILSCSHSYISRQSTLIVPLQILTQLILQPPQALIYALEFAFLPLPMFCRPSLHLCSLIVRAQENVSPRAFSDDTITSLASETLGYNMLGDDVVCMGSVGDF